jgi:adenylate cyclase class 2
MKNIEVEIQVEIENVKPLIDLMENKADFLYEDHQIDQYYTPAHRDFASIEPIKEWLRLRDSDGKYSITYKNWYRDENNRSGHCDEYESGLEKIDQLEKILNVLDFKPVVKVDKLRRAYRYKEYEVAIDKVEGLGSFVELEYKSDTDKDPKQIILEMTTFLKSLGLGKIIRNHVGYAAKLLMPKSDHLEEEL